MSDYFHSEEWTTAECADIPPGYVVRVEFHPDDGGMGYPWNENDGHGIIRETRIGYSGRPDKKPGERVLCSERFGAWLYDIAATLKMARRDGWGLSAEARATLAAKLGREPTAREIVAAAVESDFNYCRGWLDGRYSWVSIRAAVFDREGDEIGDAWLGGVEWDSVGSNRYAEEETAGDVVLMALDECGLSLRQRAEAWRAALREARARRYWAARGVATVGA